jgi:transposase, IS5 family
MSNQIELVNLDQLIPAEHTYRKLLTLLDFDLLTKELRKLEKNQAEGRPSFGMNCLFKALLLQFMEDLSDRELERFLIENLAGKYFCGFSISDKTPHYTLFGKSRKKIGTKLLSRLFKRIRESLKQQGYMNEVFTFVDASHLISKANLWEERDKAKQKEIEKLNNETLPKVARDKQAKIGCKGKNKFWYGFKKHVSVDMQSGLINKVAITPGNVTDAKGMKHVCPESGAVYADKGYCTQDSTNVVKRKGCHDASIKKNNMKEKNKDKDRWISQIRSPYERVFSKTRKRTRYLGVAKNQFTAFMEAISFNLKRLLVLEISSLELI